MKTSSIVQYIIKQQRLLYTSIFSTIFLLTASILLLSTHYRIETMVSDYQERVADYMEQFFDTYRQRSVSYNQNQAIRNIVRYAADISPEEEPAVQADLFLPSDTSLYADGRLVYPIQNSSALPVQILKKIDKETLMYSDDLYYLVPYYNFTQSKQLGLICYRILPRNLTDYCIGNIPPQLAFTLYDDSGNLFYQSEGVTEELSSYPFASDKFSFSGNIYIDTKSYYSTSIVFLFILFMGCVAGMLLSMYFSRRLSKKIVYPIDQLVISLKHNQEGELTYVPIPPSNLKEIDQLSSAYEEMLYRIRHLVEQNHKQNLLKTESELKVLQERINPHFLFNTLELISSQAIMEDADKTAQLAQKLGSLFRYSLRMPDIIYLRQEIQYAKDYLFLQNVRYNDRLHYRIVIPDTLSQYLIPKLTLQPILENCFKHAFSDETDREHDIEIIISEEPGSIIICIQDNGCGISQEQADTLNRDMALDLSDFSHFIQRSEHIGLRNVNARLCSYYNTTSAITICPAPAAGTRVCICLPNL